MLLTIKELINSIAHICSNALSCNIALFFPCEKHRTLGIPNKCFSNMVKNMNNVISFLLAVLQMWL